MKSAGALVKLVIFTVVTVLATGVLAATISNVRFGPSTTYYAVFSDVTGVLPGDDVRIAGVRVGTVKDVALHEGSLAKIRFDLDSGRTISEGTRAVIRYRNLVGQRYVALVDGPGSPAPLPPESTIPLSRTEPALDLTLLFNGFKPLFAALSPDDVNTLAYEIIRTLQGEGGTVNSLLAHTASLTTTLADRDQVIGEVIDNLNSVLETVDERDRRLAELIVELQRFVSGLAEDRDAIGESLGHINDLTTETASLVKNARPSLRTDIDRLGAVTKTLDDHEEVVDRWLQRLPTKLETITRTATYGSWFNFYLCDFTGKIVLPDTGAVYTPNYHVDAGRCRK